MSLARAILLAGAILMIGAYATPSAAEESGSISGTVWQDDNGDGVRQSSETPGRIFSIQLKDEAGGDVPETLFAEDGSFEFPALAPGNYSLMVSVGPDVRQYLTAPVRAVEGLAVTGVNIQSGTTARVDFGVYPDSKVPRFGGLVHRNGDLLSSEPDVRAFISGKMCSAPDALRPPQGGASDYYVAVFPSELVPGCGADGAEVTFTVNGEAANETGVWRAPTPLNLTTSLGLTAGAPLATPASTEAPSIPAATASTEAVIRPPDTGDAGLR